MAPISCMDFSNRSRVGVWKVEISYKIPAFIAGLLRQRNYGFRSPFDKFTSAWAFGCSHLSVFREKVRHSRDTGNF